MNALPINPTPPLSREDGVDALLDRAHQGVRHCYQEYEQRVRRSPTAAVFGALAAGYCLHRLPVRSILVTQVRLLSALAPPALFLFGAAKVYEFLQRPEVRDRPVTQLASL